ncbi:nucleoside-diphosphate kinase [Candidatus Daviesbacteria bacterium]|nr:nucleoside-diphosphate kinase [Candidatus Daviesbacteria bacterium]
MKQQTLIIIKPDGVERNLIGKIISYYEEAGLKVIRLKMVQADRDLIMKHYEENEDYMRAIGQKSKDAGNQVRDTLEYGRMIVQSLRDYMTSGPVVPMVLEGDDAIARARKITGFTDPTQADKGTIRGDLGNDSIAKANSEGRPTKNLIHASGNGEEAEKEIELWFGEE